MNIVASRILAGSNGSEQKNKAAWVDNRWIWSNESKLMSQDQRVTINESQSMSHNQWGKEVLATLDKNTPFSLFFCLDFLFGFLAWLLDLAFRLES
ncbi:MAG TPA: hypothetical protein V6C65_11035 [Allocoleopsis sp.]